MQLVIYLRMVTCSECLKCDWVIISVICGHNERQSATLQVLFVDVLQSFILFVFTCFQDYVVGSESFWPGELFKVTEIKQLAIFQQSLPLFQHTFHIYELIDGTIYPSQHFPFGAAFVCQARKFGPYYICTVHFNPLTIVHFLAQ